MSGVGRRLRLYTLQYFADLTSENPLIFSLRMQEEETPA